MRFLLPSLLLICVFSQPAGAQPAADRDAVLDAIRIFFDGFAAKDSTAMQQVTDPEGRLVVTSFNQGGNPTMRSFPMDQFIRLVASRDGAPVREEYWNPEVTIHDNLATVWTDYNLWVGDEIDHCGKDSFQLFRSMTGWVIIAIADTQRRDGCIPHE